ncbi:MAG: tRNA-(ms[2]io[6]A)-hydroxylase [Gammaproteobacteria bacterium]|nr:tRNA-(ms[2]io[6]A)-hydroxylase [Gammaproteobacteria bacterium]
MPETTRTPTEADGTPPTVPDALLAFLPCPTPDAWVDAALRDTGRLLIDHANCERKAATTALNLLSRYTDDFALMNRLSRLAREEMRHFEKVIALMERRGIAYRPLSASRYASRLHAAIRRDEPGRRIDTLIVGALIEARSCERFARLAPHLDDELRAFYESLLVSEARHYRDYLALARTAAGGAPLDARVRHFAAIERELVESPDGELRFHSGPPDWTDARPAV